MSRLEMIYSAWHQSCQMMTDVSECTSAYWLM